MCQTVNVQKETSHLQHAVKLRPVEGPQGVAAWDVAARPVAAVERRCRVGGPARRTQVPQPADQIIFKNAIASDHTFVKIKCLIDIITTVTLENVS